MDAGDFIAIYAAVVATGALGWQFYAWRHARTNRVSVDVAIGLISMTDGRVVDAVIITATNRGEQPVRVTGAGVDTQDGSGRGMHILQQPPGATIPGSISPNDSAMTFLLRSAAEQDGLDVFRPVTGWVRLATKELIHSEPHPLMRR